MIYEIFGLPGTGKTTALTAEAQAQLKGKSLLGLPVHKNIYTSFYCQGCNKLIVDELKDCAFEDATILIDEISLYFDNRNFKCFDSEYVHFFKTHRHDGIDLVWASQSINDADKKIRDVTDTIFLCENARFGYSVLKRIYHNAGFNHGIPFDRYDIAPRLKWIYIRRKKYYKYFDSFETYKANRKKPTTIKWDGDQNGLCLNSDKHVSGNVPSVSCIQHTNNSSFIHGSDKRYTPSN